MHISDTLKKLIFVVAGTLFIIYGLTKLIPYLQGPELTILSPLEGDIVATTTFQVYGKARRATVVKVQGKPVSIDPYGYFNETLVSYFPYTILVVEATDRYGKIEKIERTVTPSTN